MTPHLPIATIVAALATSAIAETITVCAKGCDYTSINAAIAVASDGDVIQLAAETYFEGVQIDTLGKAITLRGVLGKDGEPASVLDGAGTHRVLICQSGEAASTVIERLVIQNGYGQIEDAFGGQFEVGGGLYNAFSSSPTLTNCTFTDNSAYVGGAIGNNSSSPTLANCTFTGNSAISGGGMFNGNSSPNLSDCMFTENTAGGAGGGMYNFNSSSPTLADCTFANNSAYLGGGMENNSSSPTLAGCTFTGNSADSGGGMYNYSDSNPSLADCTFTSNSAEIGGGMHSNQSSSPTLANCTFTENSAAERGGAIFFGEFNDAAGSQIVGCFFSLNRATVAGDGIYLSGSSALDVFVTACVFAECCQISPVGVGDAPELGNDLGWPCTDCVGDVTCTAMVNAGDLGRLLSAWDTTQQRYDLNQDGIVDAADLGLLIAAWGPCD